IGQAELDGQMAYLVLDAGDEKNRQGSDIPIRQDLAADLREWINDKRSTFCGPDEVFRQKPLFVIPSSINRAFDLDIAAAGIPKRDERGRVVDLHALRTTFGTMLSKGGVQPRTAQAAMRHSDIRLTMGVYTDP
ncbi:MAG: tyrosine-type recombinase/integrase, partial [Planctomycetales bacterium]